MAFQAGVAGVARTIIACMLIGVSLLATCGCAPNTQGMMRPTLPWTRGPLGQSPGYPGAGYPGLNGRRPGDELSSIFSTPPLPPSATKPNSARWGYLNEMLRRADQQELLAEKQRQELASLRSLQEEQLAKDREYVTGTASKTHEYDNRRRSIYQPVYRSAVYDVLSLHQLS